MNAKEGISLLTACVAFLMLCLGLLRAQERKPNAQDSRVFKGMRIPEMPDKKDNPYWKECSDWKPLAQAADDSSSAVCTDKFGHKYDLVMRPVSRTCQPVTPKLEDDYKHYICSEQDELMIKPQSREGDSERRRDLGVPALR